MIKLSVLGASGSIGKQALEVAEWLPREIGIVALTAHRDWRFLAAASRKYQPDLVAIADESCYTELKRALADTKVKVAAGAAGLAEAASLEAADTVLAAISGLAGLMPLLAAIEAKKHIALANKEALVAAGELVMRRSQEQGIDIRPVDSEHAALWQCLAGESSADISRLILTASGGAFRDLSAEELAGVTPAQALRHPNWRMGAKITVDCATMVNKGLEIIEAHWLFGVPYAQIEVVVHPESIVHSLVAFRDGSVKAQLGWPDMRLPIQYALLNRSRPANPTPPLDLTQVAALHFRTPDTQRFPALAIMRSAGERGGTAPAYLNAANEELVRTFLAEQITFTAIADLLGELLAGYHSMAAGTPEAVYEADAAGREDARRRMEQLGR